MEITVGRRLQLEGKILSLALDSKYSGTKQDINIKNQLKLTNICTSSSVIYTKTERLSLKYCYHLYCFLFTLSRNLKMNTRARCQQNGHNYIEEILSVNHLGLDKDKKNTSCSNIIVAIGNI